MQTAQTKERLQHYHYTLVKKPVAQISFVKSMLAIAVLAVFSVLFQMQMQNGLALHENISCFLSPILFGVNWWPPFLFISLLYFLTNRITLSFLIYQIPVGILLTANYFKVMFRSEPLVPVDLTLWNEAIGIAQNYEVRFTSRILVAILLLAAVTFLTYRFLRSKPLRRWPVRIVGALLSLVCIVTSYAWFYSNPDYYDRLYSYANIYSDESVTAHKGFVYSFLTNISRTFYHKPEGYSKEAAAEILEPYAAAEEKPLPNVIAIMSEAFFDPQMAEKLEFYENPLPNWNRLKKEGYSGEMVVPGFAGSTASTEFEFLSGANISLISESLPAVYKTYINRPMDALPRLFKEQGFAATALHPGHEWFYNRQNVYPRMGFDAFLSLNDFPEGLKEINYYVTDEETTKLVIDHYQAHLDSTPEQGYFNFTVTIQNHGPYIDEATDRPLRYVRPEGMEDTLYYTINNYLDGVADADTMLGEITDYAETLDVPTVVVFFGDHLPYFDQDMTAYDYLGYDISASNPESLLRRYTVPWLMWSNSAAKESFEPLSGESEIFSSNFLPLALLEYMDQPLPPYYAFLKDVREQVNVISPHILCVDGEYLGDPDAETAKWLDRYRILQYDRILRYGK